MNYHTINGLFNNTALLLAIVVLYDSISQNQWEVNRLFTRLISGAVIGCLGIAVMLNPWEFSEGVVFDARSILLSITGLFFGFVPASIACIFTGLFRFYLGGAGQYTGVAVILSSGAIGVAWRYFRRSHIEHFRFVELYALGIVVHIVMLLWMLTLPAAIAFSVLRSISLPVIVIFPIGSALFGQILLKRMQYKKEKERIREREELFRTLFETMTQGVVYQDRSGKIISANPAAERILGIPLEKMKEKTSSDAHWQCIHPDGSAFPGDTHPSMAALNTGTTVKDTIMGIYNPVKEARVWINVNAVPLFRSDEKEPYQVYTIFDDITERKAAEEKLYESKAILEAALNNSQAGIAIAEAPDGRLRYVNNAGLLIRGKSSAEIVNGVDLNSYVSSWRILHLDGVPYRREEVPLARAVLFGETCSEEFIIRRDNHEDRHVLANAAPIKNQDGDVIAGIVVFLDITERRELDKTLKKREAQYSAIVENSGDAIIRHDKNHRFTYVNPATIEIIGIPKERFLGKTFWEVGFPDHLCALWEKNVQNVFDTGQQTVIEFDIELPKGLRTIEMRLTPEFVNDNTVNSVIGISRDITEHRRSEEKMQEQKNLLQTILDNIPLMVAFLDESGKHFWVNKTWEKTMGWSLTETQSFHISLDSYVDPNYRHYIDTVIREAKSQWSDFKTRTRIGVEIDAQWLKVVFSDGTHIAIGEDVTDRKKAEKKRNELEKQLFQSQKMEAIGRLAGGVAHDFNNLLSIILGYTEMILEDTSAGDPLRTMLEEVFNASLKAKDLTRQLLVFGRKQIFEFKTLDVNGVIGGFQKLIRRVIGEDIELIINLTAKKATTEADMSQLEQVLMNLTVNARDAMPDGGVLTFETDVVHLKDDDIAHRPGVIPGQYVVIAVSDTGVGMDRDTQTRIFEPFFSTKDKDKGTGLGLSTVYGIVKQHSGNIWVYSEPGQGTIFRIYLPYSTQSPSVEALTTDLPKLPVDHITIMVVEDDSQVRNLVINILTARGYHVISPKYLSDTVEMARKYTDSIHLLLTDVIMPNVKGPDIFRQLKQSHPETKVLYMSGYTENVIAHHGVLEEGISFIQKPFSAKTLMAKVSETISKEQSH